MNNVRISKMIDRVSAFGIGSPDGPKPKFKVGDKVKTDNPDYTQIWTVGDWDEHLGDRRYRVVDPVSRHKLWMNEKNMRKAGAGMSDADFRNKVYRIMKKIALRYGGTASGMVAAGDLDDGSMWSATIVRQNASNGEVAGRLELLVRHPDGKKEQYSEFMNWDKTFEKAGIPVVNAGVRTSSMVRDDIVLAKEVLKVVKALSV
jgi:hypothetical protein